MSHKYYKIRYPPGFVNPDAEIPLATYSSSNPDLPATLFQISFLSKHSSLKLEEIEKMTRLTAFQAIYRIKIEERNANLAKKMKHRPKKGNSAR